MEWTSSKRNKIYAQQCIHLEELDQDELDDAADKIDFGNIFYPNNMHYGEPALQLHKSQEAYNFFQIVIENICIA